MLRALFGGYITLGHEGCGSYTKKQSHDQEIKTPSREVGRHVGQTWGVRNTGKEMQIGSLVKALYMHEGLCMNSPQMGAKMSILSVRCPDLPGYRVGQGEKISGLDFLTCYCGSPPPCSLRVISRILLRHSFLSCSIWQCPMLLSLVLFLPKTPIPVASTQ